MGGEYETDIVLWSDHQAALLRRLAAGERVNNLIDWVNVIDEVETVGRSERAALRSHIGTAIEHLMKLEASPSADPRQGWRETIIRARRDIERVLDDSPSLRREIASIVVAEVRREAKHVQRTLALYGETPRIDIAALHYDPDQVIGDWLPRDPPS